MDTNKILFLVSFDSPPEIRREARFVICHLLNRAQRGGRIDDARIAISARFEC
jgi:hypothetical protein